MSSKSRSSSRSGSHSPKRERVDRFGRTITGKRHSKSRSRSRSRSRDRRYRGRTWGRNRSRSRDRSRSSSRFSGRRRSPVFNRNRTNIEDPKYLNARVFIGNLPADKVTKEQIEDLFKEYGTVLGVSVHDRGYGFVQYELEEQARKAVEIENGSLLKGNVLDVKMAAEGRRGGPGRGGRGQQSSPPPYNRDGERDRDSRDRGGYGAPPPRDGRAPPGAGRERSPIRGEPYEDRYRDPYARRSPPPARESGDRPPAELGGPRDMPPVPRPRDERDPYYPDPYRRPPPDDPYLDRYRDDPYRYRRDPYADPYRDRDPYYRDPYDAAPPPRKPLPTDCQIIMMNAQLREYAEMIEGRLRQASIVCDIVTIPDDRSVPQMVEEASLKKCLFAIVVNAQNEVHRSLTLNILHGTPQEHRNMPTDDAISLVGSSFEGYMAAQKEKAAAPAPVARAVPAPFIPPAADISYLLNLLADNRQLTVEEIDKVLDYLKERRDKLLAAEGRRPPAETGVVRTGVAPPAAGDSSSYLQQEQQELQAKILSILNGSGSSTSTAAAPAVGVQAQSSFYGHTQGVAVSHPAPQLGQQAKGSSSLINFDNPNVQKALDNLIQSGPNLLKGIPSSANPQSRPQAPGLTSRSPMQPQSQQQMGYGGAHGNYPSNNGAQQSSLGGMQQQRAGPGYMGQDVKPRVPQQGMGMRPRMM